MGLFNRTKKDNTDKSSSSEVRIPSPLGNFTGVSHPFKKAEKEELNRNSIINNLDSHKGMSDRLLQESCKQLKNYNRLMIKPQQRREFTELLASYIYPLVLPLYEKYKNEDSSLPESSDRKNTLIASVEVIQQLSISYKLLFREYYSYDQNEDNDYNKLAYLFGAHTLELIRLEQRLLALRYQKLPKVSWQHCNEIFFSLHHHNHIDDYFKLIELVGIRKSTDKPQQQEVVPGSSVKKLYFSLQLFGLLDVTTWPTRIFHVPDAYLDILDDGLKIVSDDGEELKPGFVLTHCKNEFPPFFQRQVKMPSPSIQIELTSLYNKLSQDHEEIGKQLFTKNFDITKISRPLTQIKEVDRITVLELMIMGLTERKRMQKRHASFDSSSLSVYFGFKDVYTLLKDLTAPDQEKVKESRLFIDSLAKSSALLAKEGDSHMSVGWVISNFSAGGVLISTDETDFSSPVQIDMLVAFIMPEKKAKPILGFVRRLNQSDSKQIEIAIVRLSSYAENAGVQTLNDIDSKKVTAAILIKNISGEWNIILTSNMNFAKGEPLKLIRADGTKLPVRLGEPVYSKKEFKVYELSLPKLEQ